MRLSRLAALVALVLCASGAWAIVQSTPSSPLGTSKMLAVYAPSTATAQDYQNFHDNLANGTNLPSIISVVADEGTVTGKFTGLVLVGTGERQFTATITDQQLDMYQARTYVNGTLVVTATVPNGGIIVRSGIALATMSVLLSPVGQSDVVEVQWDDSTGFTRKRTLQGPL